MAAAVILKEYLEREQIAGEKHLISCSVAGKARTK